MSSYEEIEQIGRVSRVPCEPVRLGYACVNNLLKSELATNSTCRLANAHPERLEELSRSNLSGLFSVLKWNALRGITLFRISSQTIPFASHPKAQWPWQEVLAEELALIGDFAAEHSMRLTMHPGQYTVLSSPKEDTVAASLRELEYHAAFLDLLGMDGAGKIILHGGGAYGDPASACERFATNFCQLSDSAQRRLVIENDEYIYGSEDVLRLCKQVGVPMILDTLHHEAHAGEFVSRDLIEEVAATWRPEDGPPKFHMSSQKEGGRVGAHDDYVQLDDFKRFTEMLPEGPIDIMLEAKAKERALQQLCEKWSAQ